MPGCFGVPALLLADGQLDRVGELAETIRSCDPSPLRDLVLGQLCDMKPATPEPRGSC
jgi:hypothetical protein